MIIAIDGPSGSGKSSTSRGVARRLGLRYVDTGAMYRAITWWALNTGIDPADAATLASRGGEPDISFTTDPDDPRIMVDGRDISAEIRAPDVSGAVSLVSAVPEIRARLVELQRQAVAEARTAGQGVVMEGRDIGTVVLPDADLKVFLTADAQARAQRRAQEDAERAGGGGVDGDALSAAEQNLRGRDLLDSTRKVSPLQAADGAVHIDGTDLTLEQVIDSVVAAATIGDAP